MKLPGEESFLLSIRKGRSFLLGRQVASQWEEIKLTRWKRGSFPESQFRSLFIPKQLNSKLIDT